MKKYYLNAVLTVIAVNMTIQTADQFIDPFVPEALANFSSVQKIAICDELGIKCADISSLVRGSLLVKEGS
jgi:hypothetical protein